MPLAPLAVLVKLQPLRVVALALIGLVITPLALLTGEGGSDTNISTCHDDVLSWRKDGLEAAAGAGTNAPRRQQRSVAMSQSPDSRVHMLSP
jgi:hypothetical protein